MIFLVQLAKAEGRARISNQQPAECLMAVTWRGDCCDLSSSSSRSSPLVSRLTRAPRHSDNCLTLIFSSSGSNYSSCSRGNNKKIQSKARFHASTSSHLTASLHTSWYFTLYPTEAQILILLNTSDISTKYKTQVLLLSDNISYIS